MPSHPDLEVVGTFNAGATMVGDEVVLLVRVAERPVSSDGQHVGIPTVQLSGASPRIDVQWIARDDPDLDISDPRGIVYRGRRYLSNLSHLRLARSRDGFHFEVDPQPTLVPATPYEVYGMEDPRITLIEGQYYVAYTSPSPWGVTVSLIRTADFRTFERMGVIFAPENKDVVLFPGRAGDRFVALHRPTSPMFGDPDIWVAYSPDLVHWGDHRRLFGIRPGLWDGGRIGGGAVPIETPQGWLEIYHGAVGHRYCLGTALLDREQPHRLLGRSREPIMTPLEPYERAGFFGAVVFSCGAVQRPTGEVLVYYGAADSTLGVAVTTVDELLGSLEPVGAVTAA
ncbi:MAG: glycoside hydrolase family 130 protein [Limnochordaceae bacterium]|nr:glycoside hydrolase family 130 protein [Limnochordaceae bacterium]